jgi:aryl-alcohol dehydrogenase-like predicted oxidoreductase
MELRNLGASSLKVSPLGLGLAALGRPAYINIGHADDLDKTYDMSVMERNTHHMLDLALSLGINYFDAARSYGKAEEFLGSWLLKKNPNNLVIGSKWGYAYTADWKINVENHEIKEHSLSMLQQQWEESQQALERIPHLYQVHSATLESGILENKGVLKGLAKIKSEGVLIGITVSGDKQTEILEKAIETKIEGKRLFDTIQATWNLLEPSASHILNIARKEGMGVIIKEGVANGRLTHKNNDPDFNYQKKLLKDIAGEHECDMDAIAIAAILHQPWVDIVLSGAATENQLLSNMNSLKVRFKDGQLEELLSQLQESPETYWSKRKDLPWN